MPDDYLLTVLPPAGITDLKISSLAGNEELGRSFEYQLNVTSKTHTLSGDDFLGKPMAVQVKPGADQERFVHGIVTVFRYLGSTTNHASYQLTLRPWSWLLSKRATCRIFQQKTAPEIVLEVFREAGFNDFENALTETYHQRDYCVQYRESDLDFVTRLMEQEGFYYLFVHSKDRHVLKLVDSSSAHPDTSRGSYVFNPSESHIPNEQLRRWQNSRQLLTAKYRLNDYNFLNPQGDLKSASVVSREHTQSTNEIYDYPGLYETSDVGSHFVKTRVQEQQAVFEVCEGEGPLSSLNSGEAFEVTDHSREDQNKKYIALRTELEISVGQQEMAGTHGTSVDEMRCVVRAFPVGANFRLNSMTTRPRIQGPQTAVVVGPSGKEIYTDEHGRVKLKFHWDLTDPKDETVSCWVRVAQVWAGGTWGAIHIPRIGQEVVVEFLEGDPDRPLVTGRVYNAALMPPYELSANQTQSGIKTRSTPDGDAETFNELRFEDKKGEEEIYLHAEKNFTRIVENNDVLKVGFDKQDKGDQTIEIFNDQTTTIGHNDAETANRTTTLLKGHEALTLNKGNRTVTLDEGNDKHQLKKGNREVLIDQGNDTLTIAQGDQAIQVTSGKITIEAGTSIELKVGSNSIKIETSGITISASKVTVSATGQLELSGSAQAKLTSGGIVTVQGSLVKIN